MFVYQILEGVKTAVETLAIIPARGGSKGVPGKNIRLLGDKPLIAWTIEAALGATCISRVVVSTDDAAIKSTAISYGAEVIDRPPELARDDSPTFEVIRHAVEYLHAEGYIPEEIVLLQCISPFRTTRHINEAFALYLEKTHLCDTLISVTKEEIPPQWLLRMDTTGLLADFLPHDNIKYHRRQDFEQLYKPNGAIYIGKTSFVLENNGFAGCRTIGYPMDAISSIDIDTEADFKYAEFVLKND